MSDRRSRQDDNSIHRLCSARQQLWMIKVAVEITGFLMRHAAGAAPDAQPVPTLSYRLNSKSLTQTGEVEIESESAG